MLCLDERKRSPEGSSQVQNISLHQGLFILVFLFYPAFTILSPLSLYFPFYLPELPKSSPQPCTLELMWLLGQPLLQVLVQSPPTDWGSAVLVQNTGFKVKVT